MTGKMSITADSHSLRGLCGLKSQSSSDAFVYSGHSLRGLCGLKYRHGDSYYMCRESQPARAVWIEIDDCLLLDNGYVSHSLRGLCGLKYYNQDQAGCTGTSQPARAVWIEIYGISLSSIPASVTACEGCVD